MASSSSTPATLAPVAPQGPTPSSTLPGSPPPTPPTHALAAPQEADLSPIRIATYNLGVYPELACTSTQKANEFEDKLHADLENFRNAGVQVICFQEVNDILLKKISLLLPKWVLHHAPSLPKVVIAREGTEWRQVFPLFPDDPWCRHTWWNKFLQVSAGHLSVRSFA
jgi:hypothetical protein